MRPFQTPLEAGDKVAAVLHQVTATPGQDLTLSTIATRRFGGVEAFVIFHLNDGSREYLLADEARLMSAQIRDTGARPAWADSLDEAAETADRQASAILLAVRAPEGVGFPREFGGAR